MTVAAGNSESLALQEPVSDIRGLILGHDQNDIVFEFTALDYFNSAMNRYKNRLENYDADWIDSGSQRNARYTNLNPGEYTFGEAKKGCS